MQIKFFFVYDETNPMNSFDIEACNRICTFVLDNPEVIHENKLSFLKTFVDVMKPSSIYSSDEEPPEIDVEIKLEDTYDVPIYNANSDRHDEKNVEVDNALDFLKSNDFQKTLICYANAIKLAPTAKLFVERGNVCMKCEKIHAAIAHYNEAEVVNPNFAPIFKQRGLANIKLENYTAAIKDLQKFQELDYDDEIEATIQECKKKDGETSASSFESIGDLFNNPEIMKAAQNVASNPDTLNQFLSNPMLKTMMESLNKK